MKTMFARIVNTLLLRLQDRRDIGDIPSFLYKHGERPPMLPGEIVTDPAQHPTHFLLTDGEMLVWPDGHVTRIQLPNREY